MGCSVSKREVKKPTKYDFLKDDVKNKSAREIRTDKESERQYSRQNYTEYQSDANKAPPTDIHSVGREVPDPGKPKSALPVIE